MSRTVTQLLGDLQPSTLPPANRLKTLRELYSALTTTVGYIPPKPRVKPPSFLDRHPRLKVVLSLAFAGFVIFCDGFVGVSTILGELLTLGGVIFGLSLGVGLILMALVILLQLSLLAKVLDLPFLKPPKTIQHQIEERVLLKQIASLMETRYFYRACQNNTVSQDDHQALVDMIASRAKLIEQHAAKLEKTRQSNRLSIFRFIAITSFALSSLCAGFSSGYFFVDALALCFPFFVPIWLPIVVGLLAGISVLAIFWDSQKKEVSQMVEWACNCNKSWIEDMTQDIILPETDVTMAALANHIKIASLSGEEQAAYRQLEEMAPRSERARRALRLFQTKDEPHDRTHGISQRLHPVSV
ncbi:MAG: hypothetical protein NTW08_04940 [Gammaproteobacteria bacterium]|nr:hypothetical protein [Gammaproteobacteria bacterium]